MDAKDHWLPNSPGRRPRCIRSSAVIREYWRGECGALRRARSAGQLLRDLPGVAARIGEGERAHTPVAVGRAADYWHPRLIQLGAHRIHVVNKDDELPNPLLRPAEYIA